MGVRIMLVMAEFRLELRYQPPEEADHIAFHVGVGIFVYRQAAGRVLGKQRANAFTGRGLTYKRRCVRSDIDHFFTLTGIYRERIHLNVPACLISVSITKSGIYQSVIRFR